MEPKIGAVVLNFNSERDCLSCVERLEEATQVDLRVYVVDNASPDGSGERLAAQYQEAQNVTVLRSLTNRGYAAGNNLGLWQAVSDGCSVLIVVNPDVYVHDGALDDMARQLALHSDVAVVGPRVVDSDGVVQKYARKPLTFARYTSIKRPFSFFMQKTAKDYLNLDRDYSESFTFEGMVSGCCFAIRASDFTSFSGLDETTFLYCEEDILGRQLFDRGRRTRISVEAQVTHSGGGTTEGEDLAFVNFHRYRSAYYALGYYGRALWWQRLIVAASNIGAYTLRASQSPEYRRRLRALIVEHLKVEHLLRKRAETL